MYIYWSDVKENIMYSLHKILCFSLKRDLIAYTKYNLNKYNQLV